MKIDRKINRGGNIVEQHRIKWVRVKLDTEVLKGLREKSNAKGLLQVSIQLIVTMGLGILSYIAFKNWSLWVAIPIFFIYATDFSFSGYTSAIHELSHNTVFKTKWLNEFFSIIFSIMSWSNYVYFRKSHTQHHAYTTFHGLDQEVVQPVKAWSWKLIYKFTFDVNKFRDDYYGGIFGIFRRAFGVLTPDREAPLFEKDKERAKLIRWDRSLLIIHTIIIVIIILTKAWIFLLLFSFTIFFGQWLNVLIGSTQHAGLSADVSDFRKNCRLITLGPINGFLYWQMHYHIEHHMYAAVPFYNLKALYRELKPYLPERAGLIPAWKEIIGASNLQKKDPTYFVSVDVPEI